MSVEPLHELAALTGAKVRFVTRFVEDAEIPAIFRRADVVALPYLDAEHSGVLYTGLAFGKPLVVSAVGGFPEVAETGAARLVPPGDTAALAGALRELIDDPAAREELAAAARAAAAGPYSWDEAARLTLALYEELLAGRPARTPTARRSARDHVRGDRLLALRAGDRLRPGRLPVRAPRPGHRPPRPRNARRPAGAAPLGLAHLPPPGRAADGLADHPRLRRGGGDRRQGRQRAARSTGRASACRSSSPTTAPPTPPRSAPARPAPTSCSSSRPAARSPR